MGLGAYNVVFLYTLPALFLVAGSPGLCPAGVFISLESARFLTNL
jgi:hypothetical protein